MTIEIPGLFVAISSDAKDPVAPIMVSSESGSFRLPGSIFQITSELPRQLFTGISLLSTLSITIANGTLSVAAGEGQNGGMGGLGALHGGMIIDVLGGLIPLLVPLTVVGGGDTTEQVGAAALMVTITGHAWTTGPVSATGVHQRPLGLSTGSRVEASGLDERTAGHEGRLVLVTPFRVDTGDAIGAFGGSISYNLVFVPEPGPAAALGTAIAALLALGARRRGGR